MSRATATVGLLMFVAMGCHQARYSWIYDRQADFSRLKTYSWLKGVQQGTAGRDIEGKSMDLLVPPMVDRELAAKGLAMAPQGGQPDFVIQYRSVLEFRSGEASVGSIGDQSDMVGGERYETVTPGPDVQPGVPSSYTVGTLYITMYQPGRNEVIWRGVAEAVLRDKADPESRRQRLEEAVQKIMANFPPAKHG